MPASTKRKLQLSTARKAKRTRKRTKPYTSTLEPILHAGSSGMQDDSEMSSENESEGSQSDEESVIEADFEEGFLDEDNTLHYDSHLIQPISGETKADVCNLTGLTVDGKKMAVLEWKSGADSHLRSGYAVGSRSATYKAQKNREGMERDAEKSYNIGAMWNRQADLRISMPERSMGLNREIDDLHDQNSPILLQDLPTGLSRSLSEKDQRINERCNALEKMQTLLRRKTDRIAKFGSGGLRGHLLKRYEMVHSFLLAQRKSPTIKRRTLAITVAHTFGRGEYTARWIVKWEKSWIQSSVIPSRKAKGGNNWPMQLLFEDEGLQLAIREYATGAKDSMLT